MKRGDEKIGSGRTSRTIVMGSLVAILLAGFGLRIVNLAAPDIAGDDALYAMRAIGWVDYVAAVNRQSTPVSWFAEKQWWQGLSFHDAPPLVFALQWIFFKLGGDNAWAARLPFVFAGTLAVFALFLLGKQLAGPWAGLASAAALAVMNYAVFASRIGLLDGFLVLWIALAFYFFLKADRHPVNYLAWGATLGAGLLTKYTFVFILPAFLLAVLLWRRRACTEKRFYAGIALCLLLLAPVIIYNAEVFRSRGHFDAALSTLVGQHPDDFRGLTREFIRPSDPIPGLLGLVRKNFSIGFIMLLAIGAGAFAHRMAKDKTRRSGLLAIVFGGAGALGVLSFLGVADRFGPILLPFMALFAGLGVVWTADHAPRPWRTVWLAFAALAVAWEIVFAVQTQLMARPILHTPLLMDSYRPVFTGYQLLDRYVADFYRKFPEPSPIVIFQDEPQLASYQRARIETRLASAPNGPFQKHLLVFDDRMRWFAWVWIFERRRLYDADPIHSIGQLIEKIQTRGPSFYTALGLEDATIIVADDRLREDDGTADGPRTLFVHALAAKAKPIDEIRDPDGRPLFKIFRLPLAAVRQAPAAATRSR